MLQFRHSVALVAALAVLGAVPAGAQPASTPPAPGEATYLVFVGGREVGREQATLANTAGGWTITSTGRFAAPFNLAIRKFEVTYAPDWQPLQLSVDAAVEDAPVRLSTSFSGSAAISEITQKGATSSKTDQISPRAVVLPNNFYAAYEALAARLAEARPGDQLPVYVAPSGEVPLQIRSVTPSTYQTPSGPVSTRTYAVTFQNPTGPLDAEVTVDARGRFARLEIGGGTLTVARQDLAGVATREEAQRNPTDTDVTIPAAGFTLAGTLTTPPAPAAGRTRHPAVVLVGGSGPIGRDSTVAGIPLFAQLAGQLAEMGYIVLRYDKRGIGQSGGRVERVTLQDYADDLVAAVKWLRRRRDVENRQVFVAGHSEGAAVAMLAAAREKNIAALVLMAAMGTTGRELILEQQRYVLDVGKIAGEDRQEKIALQERILEAAVEEEGWDALPPEVRRAVDTPWYRSLLNFDPAAVMPRIRQPLLILHGGLDVQVPPHHAERLAALAKARKGGAPVEVKAFPRLNHLLVSAETGHLAEYASLEPKTISSEIARAIASWLSGLAR